MHSGTLIFMRNVPGKPKHRALTRPLPFEKYGGGEGLIPAGYEWDGSSVPFIFQGIFPRHLHPIASCRHDWRCEHAQTLEERRWGDAQFEADVGTTSWWVTKKIGYAGVTIGSYWAKLRGKFKN